MTASTLDTEHVAAPSSVATASKRPAPHCVLDHTLSARQHAPRARLVTRSSAVVHKRPPFAWQRLAALGNVAMKHSVGPNLVVAQNVWPAERMRQPLTSAASGVPASSVHRFADVEASLSSRQQRSP